jgi:hypothetical protein
MLPAAFFHVITVAPVLAAGYWSVSGLAAHLPQQSIQMDLMPSPASPAVGIHAVFPSC